MVGAVPARYQQRDERATSTSTRTSRWARGAQIRGLDVTAMEMTKWFDTNYHYIVPELSAMTASGSPPRKPFDEYLEARAAGIETVPVLARPG